MNQDVKTILKWIFIAIPLVVGIGVFSSFMGMFGSVVSVPSRVISKTMETNNIINNYEWFHDANAQYMSRISQAREYKKVLNDSTVNSQNYDKADKSRFQIELSAIRQSCRDLATRYNANATKSNRSIFMGREAPETLSVGACDAD